MKLNWNILFFIPVFIITSLLSSCANMEVFKDHFQEIKPGLTKQQVIGLVGNPQDKTFDESKEHWNYTYRKKIITFSENRVISLKKDETAIQRKHEIKRAKAGSTKININTSSETGEYGIRSANNHPCSSSLDCKKGFCANRGDGKKYCMDRGIKGDYCNSSINCRVGLYCKETGNGIKVCL